MKNKRKGRQLKKDLHCGISSSNTRSENSPERAGAQSRSQNELLRLDESRNGALLRLIGGPLLIHEDRQLTCLIRKEDVFGMTWKRKKEKGRGERGLGGVGRTFPLESLS